MQEKIDRRTFLASMAGYPLTAIAKDTSGFSNEFIDLSLAPFSAQGDGVTDNWRSIDSGLQHASETGLPLYFPPGRYVVFAQKPGPVLLGRSGVEINFAPGAVLILKNPERYPLTCFFEHQGVEKIKYIGLNLDGCGEIGANGLGANNSKNILCKHPKVTGFLRDPFRGGGRGITFQFNCRNIRIEDSIVEKCTTGLDFHASTEAKLKDIVILNPFISQCEEALSFYALSDGNHQIANKEDFQVTVSGGFAHNCGRSTKALSNLNDGLAGGVIVSERGHSFSIQGLSAFNDSDYGKIGALVRGTLSKATINVQSKIDSFSLIMFSPALNLLPVTFNSTVQSSRNNISLINQGSADYFVYSENTKGEDKSSQNEIIIHGTPPRIEPFNPISYKNSSNTLKFTSSTSQESFYGLFSELPKGSAHSSTR